jgi:hypothetical protein
MARRIPVRPAHPERICWGCDRYCAANDLRCGNGKERAQHPIETLGPDWMEFLQSAEEGSALAPHESELAPQQHGNWPELDE